MLSVTSTPLRTRTIRLITYLFSGIISISASTIRAQDNSPYSRYGIGDLVPQTNIIGRAMGGISAAYHDYLSINLNNPASYASFEATREVNSKKLSSGRAILDLGVNFEARSLRETNPAKKFTASNALFSYLQVGMPIRRNWGLSFGLRPVSRISYKVVRNERLIDPITGLPIDSAATRFEGDGGSYLPSLGTGIALFHKQRPNRMEEKLNLGVTVGYLFGKKDHSSRRALINDTVEYQLANFQTKTTFGNLFVTIGAQYKLPLNTDKKISLTIGAYGNWNQNLDASQDILRETFIFNESSGTLRLDSVSDRRDVRGKLVYPASVTAGFVVEKSPTPRESGWLFGLDFSQQSWDQYRLYDQTDSVRNKWEIRAGGQFNPAIKRNYFNNMSYRAGFFIGPDYIQVQKKLPMVGVSIGLGLPIAFNAQARNQWTIIQTSFEFIKRGNNDNLLQENLYRLSVGFSLSDLWFLKRKYD